MSVIIKKRANRNIIHIIEYVFDQGYPETAQKYLLKIYDFLASLDKLKVKHAFCKRKSWAKFKYRCVVFDGKYVVAYKVTETDTVICYFTHGSKLK